MANLPRIPADAAVTAAAVGADAAVKGDAAADDVFVPREQPWARLRPSRRSRFAMPDGSVLSV